MPKTSEFSNWDNYGHSGQSPIMVHHLNFFTRFFGSLPTRKRRTRRPSMSMFTHHFRLPVFIFLGLAAGVITLACQVVDFVVHVISIPHVDRIPVA